MLTALPTSKGNLYEAATSFINIRKTIAASSPTDLFASDATAINVNGIKTISYDEEKQISKYI